MTKIFALSILLAFFFVQGNAYKVTIIDKVDPNSFDDLTEADQIKKLMSSVSMKLDEFKIKTDYDVYEALNGYIIAINKTKKEFEECFLIAGDDIIKLYSNSYANASLFITNLLKPEPNTMQKDYGFTPEDIWIHKIKMEAIMRETWGTRENMFNYKVKDYANELIRGMKEAAENYKNKAINCIISRIPDKPKSKKVKSPLQVTWA